MRISSFVLTAIAACSLPRPPPSSVLQAKAQPAEVVQATGGDASVRIADTEVAIVGRRDEGDGDLVAASVRGALADVAVAGAVTAEVAGGVAQHEEKDSDAAKVAEGAARVAEVAAVLGALAADHDERSAVDLRAKVADRPYRIACNSALSTDLLHPQGKPSLSCAIVRAAPSPTRHWALVVRTNGSGLDIPRYKGWVEARTAKGRDDSAPIFRIDSESESASTTDEKGKETTVIHANTAFAVIWGAKEVAVALLRLPSYGQTRRAWIDTSALADQESRDVAKLTIAVLSLFPWPEVKS